ncbi:hypothetical protein GYB22_04955 [bacterium]|nr:hypothetical protein [bacterium]
MESVKSPNKNQKPIIVQNNFMLPLHAVIGGVIFLVLGTYYLITDPGLWWFYSIGIVLGSLALTARTGFEYDIRGGRFRNFNSIYFTRFGKWYFVRDYPDIAIIRRRVRGRSGRNAFATEVIQYYQLTLLSEDHRRKIEMLRVPTENEARELIEILAEDLGMNATDYSPEVSEATRRRRYR